MEAERKIAVIIPAYNEEQSIGDVVASIRRLGTGYDAIVINDNSTDKTAEVARRAGALVIELPCNLGIGGAVQTGYKFARQRGYDACIQVDGDGQHPADQIPRLIQTLFYEGYDVVIGSRFVTDSKYEISFMRLLGIRILSFFLKVTTGLDIKDTTSGFRAINRKVMEFFADEYPQDYPEPESLVFVHKKGYTVKEIPTRMNSRMYGKSSITPILSIYYMIKVMLAMFIDLFKK
ncbi:MAG: glycosyltransferase family 2 protein [Syntrophorhabdaceae bacterium]|nr:glycosyltransferase family 2 protein [Syntrophorhabdales bacterium]MBP9560598.1 glycosyltransferase family 2 protein [Syntrophorhabdaceae bacterium]